MGKAQQIRGSEYWNGRGYVDGIPPKQRKSRHERRKARQNPEAVPATPVGVGRYAW